MIAFKCATCGKEYKLPDNTAGRKARCKACGEAMVVPEAPDDLFDDGPAMGDDLTSLYASNEPSEVIEQPAVAEDPLAFNPEVAFQRSDKPAATPQLPMKLIIGAGSGVLGLIVIVVVIVIVMAGGDDSQEQDRSDSLALNLDTAVPTSGPVERPAEGVSSIPSTEPLSGGPLGFPADTSPETSTKSDSRLTPPEDSELAQWSLPFVSVPTKQVAFRGLDFRVPEDWVVQFSGADELFKATMNPQGAPPAAMRKYERVNVLGLGVTAFTTINVRVSPRPDNMIWPRLHDVKRSTGEMLLCDDLISFSQANDRFEASPNGTLLRQLYRILHDDPLRHKRSVSYELLEPQDFYIHRDLVDQVEFGELMDGYRFVRISGLDLLGDYRRVHYIGYVGDLLVTAQIMFQSDKPGNLEPAERVLRSVKLLSKQDAEQLTADDATYQTWLSSKRLVFRSSPAPLGSISGDLVNSNNGDVDLPKETSNQQQSYSPNGKPYGIDVPSELNVISVTRAAVRSAPLEDGTWLSMEVHKLAGLDRRAESVVSEDGSTVLLRGRRIVVPAGVEISEIVSDRYTIKRLLYPVQTGSDIRRVEYVIKDGPYLISVLGRYPASDAARLIMLDDAAKSVQPLEDQ